MNASQDTFHVANWRNQNQPRDTQAAQISQPVQLGKGWSKLTTGSYRHSDPSNLSPLTIPPVPLDLNTNIEAYVPKDPNAHAGVEILIREAFAASAPLLDDCHILTFRNNLNKIFGTVYSSHEAWTVDAYRLPSGNGPVFLDIVKSPEDLSKTSKFQTNGEEMQRLISYGYQFESFCTGETHANPNTEYGALVKWKLTGGGPNEGKMNPSDRITVYMGAEIDCYDPLEAPSTSHGVPPLSSFREIKTFAKPEVDKQFRSLYRYKHPKWWLQSHFAGVEKLVLGARDKQGIIREIHTVATKDLPKISWNQGQRWYPQYSLAFGYKILEWMKFSAEMEKGKHVRFVYNPEEGCIRADIVEEGDLPERVQAALQELQQQQQ